MNWPIKRQQQQQKQKQGQRPDGDPREGHHRPNKEKNDEQQLQRWHEFVSCQHRYKCRKKSKGITTTTNNTNQISNNSKDNNYEVIISALANKTTTTPATAMSSQIHCCSINNNDNDNDNNNNDYSAITTPTTTTTIVTSAATAASMITMATNHLKWHNFNKINKLLMTTTLWLMITMIITTTTICQIDATALPSASIESRSPLSMPVTVPASASPALSSLSSVQQRQLQQRQLFALLSKNHHESSAATLPATATAAAAASATAPTSGVNGKNANQHDDDGDSDDIDGDDIAFLVGNIPAAYRGRNVAETLLLETSGFVADDGERYEKAERVLQAAAAAAATAIRNNNNNNNKNNNNSNGSGNGNNNINCPNECKCLDDYFDCGKKHLDHIPALPNYVKNLDLVDNKLTDETVLLIRNLTELNKLSLKRNQLETMPVLVGLAELRNLNLAHNRIQRISSDALASLPKLKNLDLSQNYLHTLEANVFVAGNKLSHLILNDNEIGSIDEHALDNLSDLIDLELNSNRLMALPPGVFKNLTKLKKLSLNDNHLEINWSTFKGLFALQKLHLKSNNIRALQDGVFHVMRSIETIELDHNEIVSLSRQGLFNLTKLQHLSLSNNSITRIEPDTWEFTQSLVSLDLSNNNISEFKAQHLDCLQRLRHLNLGHNKIQYLTENTFDCVKNLEVLNLRRNRLAWIIEDQGAAPPFKALRKLKKLDLYGNNLKQINAKSLSGLNSLEHLNLGLNALATIQMGAFDHMPHLQKFIFKSLNFICDCDLLWFHRWLQRSVQANGAASGKMQENAVCGYPEHLLDRKLLSLTTADLVCGDSPKPVITQEPSNQLAVKGANITMECIGTSPAAASLAAADELKIMWRHDNQNVRDRLHSHGGGHHGGQHHGHGHGHGFGGYGNGNVNIGGSGGGYSSTETQIHHDKSTNQTTIVGYLRMYNVSYDSAGRYQCVVSNAFGTTYSQKFKLSIGIHPKFLQIPSNVTIDSGDTARLVCSATGDPMPEIALQKFGASDFPAATERRLQVVREENAFIITNAKLIDTGTYTCTAESAAGEIKVNATLIVNDKPQPNIPLVRTETLVGQSSVLECLSDLTADLKDRPRREWYKDNKPFHISPILDSEHYYFTIDRELLVIRNTQSVDAGLYRCEITDQSKTYTLQTELIVVKEDFNQLLIIIACVVLACVVIGVMIVCSVVAYQRRKTNRGAMTRDLGGGSASGGGGGVGSGARVGAASLNMLNGSHGSALDQTQLTTLNRTYLEQQRLQQNHHQQQQQQQRGQSQGPGSMVDSEMPMNGSVDDPLMLEQRNCLLAGRGGVDGAEEGLTLEYIHRNSALHDADLNQDHLSSKDSGTGSDAAVKRSIDDFTATLLPQGDESHQPNETSTPAKQQQQPKEAIRRVGQAFKPKSADTCVDDDDDDGDGYFVPSPTLGVSQYEAMEMCEPPLDASPGGEREHFQHNNNHRYHRPEAVGVSGASATITKSNSRQNCNAAPQRAVVDI